jgi:predicted DNA-binding ribbon-helix-helix protein
MNESYLAGLIDKLEDRILNLETAVDNLSSKLRDAIATANAAEDAIDIHTRNDHS